MTLSENGLKLIESFEGLRLEVYNDAAGLPTIGYGHLITVGEDFSNGLTLEQAQELLAKDTAIAQEAVNTYVTVPLTQNQFDALCSFVYNVGTNAFKESTLLKLLNKKSYYTAWEEFVKWDHAGGKVVEGLLRRRQAEAALFAEADAPEGSAV